MILVDTYECIEWSGTIDVHGYGSITFDGRKQKAHRVAYALAIGDPAGKNVLHRCDNTKCINPKHLYLGTQKENVRDMMVRRRHTNPWPAKVTREQVDQIVAECEKRHLSQSEIGARFGITQSAVSLIANKKRRVDKWLTD